MDTISSTIISFTVVSAINIVASLSVIFTLILFRRLRDKIFMRLITFISISIVIGCLPYVSPYRPHSQYNGWCVTQAILVISGTLMSVLWTTTLTFYMFKLGMDGKIPQLEWPFHIVCWGYSILSTLGIMIFTPFEADNAGNVCTFNHLNKNAFIYHSITSSGVALFCVVVMIWMSLRINKELTVRQSDFTNVNNLALIQDVLRWYPLSFIITWLPYIVVQCIQFSTIHNETLAFLINLVLLWRMFNGLTTATIFFLYSKEARLSWKNLLFSKKDRLLSLQSDRSGYSNRSSADSSFRPSFEIEHAQHDKSKTEAASYFD